MQAIKDYAPAVAVVVLAIGLIIAIAIPFLGWVSGFGELKADVAHLDETVTRLEISVDKLEVSVDELETSVNDLRVSQEALRRELLQAIADSTAETARMINGHRHGERGEVYIELP